jgi:hypothetical protein
MMRHTIGLLFTILGISIFNVYAADAEGMRGGRYCEVILSESLSQFAVYNTWGLNQCPEEKWRELTTEGIKKETNAAMVRLNGPRYWVIDGFKNTQLINKTVKLFGGISMRKAGVLHIEITTLLEPRYYRTHEVNRKTTWVYQENKPVYELIDPKGAVYVMQSYSVELHPQTLESLSQLDQQLQLPQGWHFKTGILKKTELLAAADAKAIVVQDNYLNTYQRATHDFLP